MKKGFEILRNKKDFSVELIPEKSYYSLIWLHGLGDSSDGFFSFFQFPESPVNHGCRVKLLQAPRRASSINGGMKMNSWYDIKTFDWTKPDKELYSLQQIEQSRKILHEHVQAEYRYWQQRYSSTPKQQIYKRIFVGGFSQGCAMSLLYALMSDNLLGGIIGYSGHVFRSFELKNKGIFCFMLDKLAMFMYHGQEDGVIDCKKAKQGYDMVIGKRDNFQLKLVPDLDHSVEEVQLKETAAWIQAKLKHYKIDS